MNQNNEPNSKPSILSLVSSFAVGAAFAGLIFFATYFKGNKDYIKIGHETIEALHVKKDLYDKQMPRNFPSIDSFLKQTGASFLSDPIPDDLFKFYRYSLDSTQKAIEQYAGRKPSKYTGDNWVYIPLDELLAYATYLKLPQFNCKIQGITIYMGMVTKNNLDPLIYEAHKNYFDRMEGAIIPMLVATEFGKDKNGDNILQPYPKLLATDCNCGNPPGCVYSGNPKRECANSTTAECKDCPKPKQQ